MLNENLQFQFTETAPESTQASAIVFKIQLSAKSQNLHSEALKRAGRYLAAEASLLEIIMKIDQERLYEDFGETHLTPYCTKHLKLSEPVAANFVRVARKSLQVPELKEAIDEGRITLSGAKAIAPVITPENKLEWISKAEGLSKNNLEIEVAKASPKVQKPEKAKPQGENRIRVEFELSEEEMILFRRTQDLVSQSLGKSASLSETQKVLLEVFLEKQDPVRKAERAKNRAEKKKQTEKQAGQIQGSSKQALVAKKDKEKNIINSHPDSSSQSHSSQEHSHRDPAGKSKSKSESSIKPAVESSKKKSLTNNARKPLPAEVIHAVNLRDQGCCQARLPDGSLCKESRWVHFHHLVPLSKGGLDRAENLITLCSGHHRIWHS